MDFVRLEAATPGLGYAAASAGSKGKDDESGASAAARLFMAPNTRCPSNDGLWLMDLQTGDSRLLVSFSELLESIVQGGR